MAISKLSMLFVDGSTVIDANKMNALVSKINELVDAANGSSSGGTQGGGDTGGGQQTPTVANLFVLNDSTFGIGVDSSTGDIVEAGSICLSDYISVKANTQYTFKGRTVVAWYDSSKQFISASPSSESNTRTLLAPTNAKYCRFSFNTTTFAPTKMVMNEGDTLLQNVPEQSLPSYPNLVDKNTVSGSTTIDPSNGSTTSSVTMSCTDYISVKANTQYTFKPRRIVAWYNSSKQFISASPATDETVKTLTSPSSAAYCRFSFISGVINSISINEGTIATSY